PRAFLDNGWWRIVTAARADHGSGETVMRGDEMENKLLIVRAKRLGVVVGFHVVQRAQLMSVAIEEVEVNRPVRLRVGATIDRGLERALPPRRALSFIMKTSRQSEEIRPCRLDTKTLGDLS